MKTFLAQNEFISNPSVISPRTEVSTADSECRLQNVARPDVTAERDPHPISNSAGLTPATAESAVASKPPPAADATAAPFHSSDGGGEQTTPADASLTMEPMGGCDTIEAPSKAGTVPSPSEAIPASTGGPQEASAPAPTKNPDADALDCIHEIFFYARKLMKQPPRFVLDEAAFMAEVEEVPLFVRDGNHLKRWA